MPPLLTDRSLRHLVLPLLLIEWLWGIGVYFVPVTTTIPAYLAHLHASPLTIGIMATAMGAFPMLLQLYGRSVIERFHQRKRGIIILHLVMIAPYFLVALSDWCLAAAYPGVQIIVTIVLLAFSQIVIGLIIPLWLDMIAQVIPTPVRGQYFGITSAFSALGGIGGALALIGLQHWLHDYVFRGAFFAAGLCFLLSMAAFSTLPVPESAFAHAPEPSVFARARKGILACHPRQNFGRLVGSMMVQAMAIAIVPFLIGYATSSHGLRLDPSIFTNITLYQAVGACLGGVALGWWVDHAGPRWPWLAVTLVVPAVLLVYPHAGVWPVLVVCSLLIGILQTHWSVSAPALLELSPPGDKSPYVAMANLAGFFPAMLAPMLFGGVIASAGYLPAFLIATLAGGVSFLIALTIRGRHKGILPANEPHSA